MWQALSLMPAQVMHGTGTWYGALNRLSGGALLYYKRLLSLNSWIGERYVGNELQRTISRTCGAKT
jgi:hypothetical protein